MAISGTFRNAVQPQAGINIWGNGINPIHAAPFNQGRNSTPGYGPNDGEVPANITDDADHYGYTPEDSDTSLYGYGHETGLADRPRLGEVPRGVRAQTTKDYPSPGYHKAGQPGGQALRSVQRGGLLTQISRIRFRRPVAEGVEPSPTQGVNDPVVSSDAQLLIQTSMAQRYQTRAGSQTPSGRADEHRAPIHSRVMGMRRPVYAGGERHEDMRPRQQTPGSHRPFVPRIVGTGDPADMRVNAVSTVQPITRSLPALPDTGRSEAELTSAYVADSLAGYTEEDPTW